MSFKRGYEKHLKPRPPGRWMVDRKRVASDVESRLSGVAACVLDAMTPAETAAAIGVPTKAANAYIGHLCERYGARNQIALALKLAEVVRREGA